MQTPTTWVKAVTRRHTPLFSTLLVHGQAAKYFANAVGFEAELRYGRVVNGDAYMRADEAAPLGAKIASRIAPPGDFLTDHARRCWLIAEQISDHSYHLSQLSYRAADSALLFRFYREYSERVLSMMPFLTTLIVVQRILESMLREAFVPLGILPADGSLAAILEQLSAPSRPNAVVEDSRGILVLAGALGASAAPLLRLNPADADEFIDSKLPQLSRAIDMHRSRFGWLQTTYYFGQPASRREIIERLQHAARQNSRDRLLELESRDRAAEEAFAAIAARVPSAAATLLERTRHYAYLRSYKSDILFQAHTKVLPLLTAIANLLDVPKEDIVFATHEEILDGLAGERSISSDAIASRKESFAVELVDGTVSIQSPSPQAVEPVAAEEGLEGVTAARGTAQGRVRIVFGLADVPRVRPGDIVVTGMTTPNMMAGLERAGGIITDEGGILCHAAVISRELHIPCIIDTKEATARLREGEMVELEAMGPRGVIRRLPG